MIALLARAQALGTALDPRHTMVRLGTSSVIRDTPYGAVVGEDESYATSYEAALVGLLHCQRQSIKRECVALLVAINLNASAQAQCFALATCLVDASDQVIHAEQRNWPAGPLPCFYVIRVEGLRHDSWADDELAKAWLKALDGLRAMALAKHGRLAEALAADDKAARS